jgi:arylsulfatase A-like enzyme
LRRVGGPAHPPGERGTAMANSDDQAGSNRPNVVFILVDNVGWGDIGCYGGVVPTPRIDALAGQGVRFKNYNVEAQCTPTRSAILSGRLPIRTGNCSVPLPGQGDYGLAPWEYTLGHRRPRQVARRRQRGPAPDRPGL